MHYRSQSVFSLRGWTPYLPTGLACPAVLLPTSCLPPTGLSPCLVGLSRPFSSAFCLWGAAPLSLATTRGMISFPPGTEMFQFPGFPRTRLYIHRAVPSHAARWISPFGYLRLKRSHTPHLSFSQCIASFFGSLRHRHSPYALVASPPCVTEKLTLSRVTSLLLLYFVFIFSC